MENNKTLPQLLPANNDELRITLVNDGKHHKAAFGTTLLEFSNKWCTKAKDAKTGKMQTVLAALVENELKDLSDKITEPHSVEFIGYYHPEGRRCYIRGLSMVLQKVIRELYPDKILLVKHSLPGGIYCEIGDNSFYEDGTRRIHFMTDSEVEVVKNKMAEIIGKDIPFIKHKMLSEDAADLFKQQNQKSKAELVETVGKCLWTVYSLDDIVDTMHGPLVPSTGYLSVFDLTPFGKGFCMQPPMMTDATKPASMQRQSNISKALEEYNQWCTILGVDSLGRLNKGIQYNYTKQIINVSEALHERKYAAIADLINAKRSQIRIIFLAGPSSSGKTSSSLRLAMQCKVVGLNPKVIELDNYFLNREDTPKDEWGNYDFESLYAMDLDLLSTQLNALLAGEEIEIPSFNFKKGAREWTGNKMRLQEKDILIMEGIHALNPAMVKGVDNTKIFRVYVSCLTSLPLDENNNISSADNRLLRRMVRDNRVRGISPDDTIMRWDSVRRGETRNIFPYQENADAIFNSALVYELALLKYYAETLLRRIHPTSPAYSESRRLLKFLGYVNALTPEEIAAIPPTSILREFIGGQTLLPEKK